MMSIGIPLAQVAARSLVGPSSVDHSIVRRSGMILVNVR